MRTPATEVWPVVHTERRRLAEDLSGLGEAQWAVPSLCPGWDVHDVLAHLVDSARTGRSAFVRELLRARLDFDRANQNGIDREKQPDPSNTLEALVRCADLTRTPPADLATRLVEAIVHGEDIRRPLGLSGTYPDAAIVRALTYQLRTPVSFGGGRERAADLRLVDSRTGTTWGEGDDVVADGLDLLLAVCGRSVDRGRLAGSAVARLEDATGGLASARDGRDR